MASIILKWLRRSLFICVCAFFLMSDNVSATGPSIDMSNYTIFESLRSPTIKCYYSDNTSNNQCVGAYSENADSRVDKLITKFDMSPGLPNGENLVANDIIEFDLTIYSTTTLSDNYQFGIVNTLSQNGGLVLINWEQTQNNSYLDAVNGGYSFVTTYHFVFFARINISSTIFSISSSGNRPFTIYQGSNNLGGYRLVLTNYLLWRKNAENETNTEQKDATQDAADEAADSGDQSAADAENATAGLTSVIGGFVSAVTSAQPTNCKINGKINNSFNMGELDLCSMPVPSFVQIISSLILIAICIPFAIVMFNRFIGLFRSFQG